MKIQEAVPGLLLCLFAMLAEANGLQCYHCFAENGASTEGNCEQPTLKTCQRNELYCFKSLRFTKANELFSTERGCAQRCTSGWADEPLSSGLKGRDLFCCTGNLCNTEKNVTTTVNTTNTPQTVPTTSPNSTTINGSLLVFLTLMTWGSNLYCIG